MTERIVRGAGFFMCATLWLAIGRAEPSPAAPVELAVTAGTQVVYDDNITRQSRERQKRDLISEVLVSGRVGVVQPLSRAEITVDARQQWFTRYTELNALEAGVSADATMEFSARQRSTAHYAVRRQEDPASFETEFGLSGDRYVYITQQAQCTYEQEISPRCTVNVNYHADYYLPRRQDLVDSYLHGVGAELSWVADAYTIWYGSGEVAYRWYDVGDKLWEDSLRGGIRRYITPQVYIDVRAGVSLVEADFYVPDTVQPTYQVSLTQEIDRQTVAQIGWMQTYQTRPYSVDVFDSYRVSGSLSRQLAEQAALSVNVFGGEGTYVVAQRRQVLLGAALTLAYELSEKMKWVLSYSFTDQSEQGAPDYRRNTVRTGLRAEW